MTKHLTMSNPGFGGLALLRGLLYSWWVHMAGLREWQVY